TLHAFVDWYQVHACCAVSLEVPFASRLGYGGKVDYLGMVDGRSAVVDWKTQRTKPGKPFRWYDKWACQLAAYAYGLAQQSGTIWTGDLISVAISSTEPGRLEHRCWKDPVRWWQAFEAAFAVWRGPLGRNYDPSWS
ncbi:MAG: hypothetical protein GY844_21475, partial [Bradyrhizobium sp.]|nr:hypothetical protein [Bradyrhizobium sp.]